MSRIIYRMMIEFLNSDVVIMATVDVACLRYATCIMDISLRCKMHHICGVFCCKAGDFLLAAMSCERPSLFLAIVGVDEEASEDEDDEEEEEEHLASDDSFAVPIVDLVPPARDTKAFETDEARKMVKPETPIPFPSEAEVSRLLALPTPLPSSLTPLSSPLPQIPSPPLPISSLPLPVPSLPTTSPTYAEAPLGYKATGIRMRAASPSLLLPSTSHKTDIPEA
ncbi:hypothetical protein Tco_0123250 [Tanacetum coccineum]